MTPIRNRMHDPRSRRNAVAISMAVALAAAALPAAALAQTDVGFRVVNARTEGNWPVPGTVGNMLVTKGTNVTVPVKYIVNVDNTGDATQPQSPLCTAGSGYVGCEWPSIRAVPGSSPIQTQGSSPGATFTVNLPDGRYLISVLADGYKLDGRHFTVPGDDVVVELQPHPLPAANIQAAVFEDVTPTNGAPDVPAERGLYGFQGHLTDYIDFVTTDVFGGPICGTGKCYSRCYDANGVDVTPAEPPAWGRCPIGALGILKIPDLGPNRYAVSVVPPDGTGWVQTTTLEGNLDWDNWVMEASTGLDSEFVQAGEPFPWSMFGFVSPTSALPAGAGTGTITGVVDSVKVYIPTVGGLALPGTIWGGLAGSRIAGPVPYPWLSLVDLSNGDTAVWVGQGNADGTFTIPNVRPGAYSLTYWDHDLNHILDFVNVTVANGEVVDMGVLPLTGWFTTVDGYVFNDLNRNGVKDPGEPGLENFPVSVKKRENSLMDRGAVTVTTDANGYYRMSNLYPLTQWLVLEAYSDLYYTTGVTWWADNQIDSNGNPVKTTVLGAGVDVSILPIIGLGGRLDWGVHAYDPAGVTDPQNGGIVGTVSYDTTRNELDPRFAAVENWQPGIPNLTVNLYLPVECPLDPDLGTPLPTARCDAGARYLLAADGSFLKGELVNQYITETWERPKNCTPRDVAGNPLLQPTSQDAVPNAGTGVDCLEAPLMGVQFQDGFSTVDGNYGFVDACLGPGGVHRDAGGNVVWDADGTPTCETGGHSPLPTADYLVEVQVPDDGSGKPMYQVTREEDINIFNGDQWVPQIPPPECAGPLHIVDVDGVGTNGYPGQTFRYDEYGQVVQCTVTTPCTGPVVTVPASIPVQNQPFADADGTVYEGQPKPLCNMKLVRVSAGRSIAPTFNYFTEVPIPGRLFAYVIDDLTFSSNPKSTLFGEKAGIPHLPVGIYDYTNRLVVTKETDYNGMFDVLLPSTNRIACPTPSGVCANLYRLVGNDPGVPGRLNPNYNPQYRTIAADFEVFPGLIVPADLAPTQVGVVVQLPGSQINQAVTCALEPTTPQLFAVSQPYKTGTGTASITIRGRGFGAARGSGTVTLDDTIVLGITSWAEDTIVVTVSNAVPPGPHQLKIKADNGQSTVNGLTFHVLGVGYQPSLFEVGPGKPYATIRSALAGAANLSQALVVVYPGQPDPNNPRLNPRGSYYENVIVQSPVKLQGVGPGGFQGATWIPGSIIDGGAYGGDTALATQWRADVAALLPWAGNQNVYEGQTVFVLARTETQFGATFRAAIDGFDIRGGDQMGFPNNINQIGGAPTGLPGVVVNQGGGIYVNAFVRNLLITNNVIQNNGGGYGGAIRIGTPNLPAPNTSNHNEDVRIANNRIIANGGTNLAGGVGVFAGADRYEIARNDICGNFSAEYGGGISVYGLSPNGRIHHNRIWFNRSYDEGGGIMIAGELPADPASLSPGSGPVEIYSNVIQANLADDDGGGIRFLMAGNHPMSVRDNFIVNNVSTHEGGGVALNDTPDVRFVNNTVMKNITTATAVTSNGSPMPAGLSTSRNGAVLQASLAGTRFAAFPFSNPLLFNNVFWDNRAGTRAGATVTGIGITGDPGPIDNWDMGVADALSPTDLLSPTSSVLQTTDGTVPSGTNRSTFTPGVVATYDTSVAFQPWRTNPNFVGALLVAVDAPPTLMGDYHLAAGSLAIDAGAASKALPGTPLTTVNAPPLDIDDGPRVGAVDIGADEFGSAGSGGGGGGGGGAIAFPSTGVLDFFNRGGAFGAALGNNWRGNTTRASFNIGGTTLLPPANEVRVLLGGSAWWNASSFGPNQEAFFTFRLTGTSASRSLLLKLNDTNPSSNASSYIEVRYTGSQVQVHTKVAGQGPVLQATIPGATFSAGQVLGARAQQDGTVTVYRGSTAIGSVNVTSGANPWPTALAQGGGRIGVRFSAGTSTRFDDFGGGSMP